MDAVDNTVSTRVCSKCRQALPRTSEFFQRDTSKAHGLRYACKSCANASRQERRKAKPDKCAREKLAAWRKAHPEYARQWRENHREECNEYARAYFRKYRQEHPERFAAYERNKTARKRMNGGSHTGADIISQYERQNHKCFYCGVKLDNGYHVDHVIPLSKGGSNGPENLVIACPTCNMRKHDKHPMDFCGRLL